MQAQQEMNRVICDVQTLQMKNQQELFSLLQSRLERVSCPEAYWNHCSRIIHACRHTPFRLPAYLPGLETTLQVSELV